MQCLSELAKRLILTELEEDSKRHGPKVQRQAERGRLAGVWNDVFVAGQDRCPHKLMPPERQDAYIVVVHILYT